MVWAFEGLKNNNNYVIKINQTYVFLFIYLFSFFWLKCNPVLSGTEGNDLFYFDIYWLQTLRVIHAYVLLYYTEHPGLKL